MTEDIAHQRRPVQHAVFARIEDLETDEDLQAFVDAVLEAGRDQPDEDHN